MTEECRRGLCQRAPPVFHLKHRHPGFVHRQVVEGLRGVGNYAQRPGRDGLFKVAISVCRAALHGDKYRARFYPARVIFHARNSSIRASACANRSDFRNQFIPIHIDIDCSLLRGWDTWRMCQKKGFH